MYKFLLVWTILVGSLPVSLVPAVAQGTASSMFVVSELKHAISPPLRNLARPVVNSAATQMLPRLSTGPAITGSQPDAVAQALSGSAPPVGVLLNFQGQSSDHPVPPDANLAVGTAQAVQIVNVTFAVYDKQKGALVLGPTQIHSIFTALGGLCGTTDGGDPVVLFDKLAGRWFVSQLAYNSSLTDNHACVAVSTSSDATGSYNTYDFPFGSNSKFIRQSAKTCSWENAERKERMMETTTDPLNHEPGRGLRITIKAAVEAFLDDEKALQLRKTSTCQSETLLRKQLLTWSREQSLAFLDQLTTARLRDFRASWKTNELVRFVDPRCRHAGASAT